MRMFLLLLGLVIVAVLVRMSFFTVDPTEFAYVTQFGEHVATYDGADNAGGAGLHWRWPWPIQSVQRLDRRLQSFDLPGTELLTHDPEGKTIDKTLAVETYACWRISGKDAVDRFMRRIGTPDRARDILGQRMNSQLGAAIGQMRMEDLINVRKGEVDKQMQELRQGLMNTLKSQVQDYGIELVDVRLRRFNHPAQVRGSIFERIKSERDKKVAYYRSKGQKEASDIKNKAMEEAREKVAHARFKEEKLKGEADTEAVLIRNQAHSKDAEFYVFLKKMEKLQSILGDNKTVLLLSSHRAIFDSLFQPPRPGGNGTMPASAGMADPKAARGSAVPAPAPPTPTPPVSAPSTPSSVAVPKNGVQ